MAPPSAAPPKRRRGRAAVRWVLAIVLVAAIAVGAWEVVRALGDDQERAGLAAFYEQPDDALEGEPGTLIRSEELLGAPFSSRAWRVMFRSEYLNGDPVVVTGTVITPESLVPLDPGEKRTVLAWGHPTRGIAPDCAPSRSFDPFVLIEGLRMMLERGYTVVAPDYVGMGTTGPNSYLVGKTAGNTMLDGVRAARAIPDARAGADVVLWGHSQGGQAVLFAAQQAPDYSPELTVRAVAAAAPAADLTALMGSHLDDISGVTIGSYAFSAYAEIYEPTIPGASLENILTPEALSAVPKMTPLCLLTQNKELHAIGQPLVGNFTTVDPTKTEPWRSLLQENSAGAVAFDAPLFIAQGKDDELVLPADTQTFVDHEKSLGIDVTFHEVAGATHGTIAYLTLPALESWLDAHG